MQPTRFRSGLDFEGFQGVDQESDPGSVQPFQFVDLINGELNTGGQVLSRSGLSKDVVVPLTTRINGLWDLDSYLE